MNTKLQIAVIDRAWVYIGRIEQVDGGITIHDALNIRRWGTDKGLGQLAATGPTENTRLDTYGTVHVPERSIISLIDVAPAVWSAQFPAPAPAVAA